MTIEELVTELFEEFDENGDGVISRREFVALIEALLDTREMGFSSDIFKKFDANHDNRISRDELVDLIVELAI